MDIFELPKLFNQSFDIVLEYTCFCAIDPARRKDYIEMVNHILKPEGELVGLLFPIDKDPNDDGPPFGVDLNATMIGQTVAMIVFVWFCMRFVWPLIINMIEQRQMQIADGLAAAEEGSHSLEKAEVEIGQIPSIEEARLDCVVSYAGKSGHSSILWRHPLPHEFHD